MENKNSKLTELEHYFFNREVTDQFINYLKSIAKVFAPQKKGRSSFAYQAVDSADQVVLDYPRTIQPLKKYFLPPREVLLSYNLKTNEYGKAHIPVEERIFFGIHSYEMQGIFRLDHCFRDGNPEWNYLTRRERSLFIGTSFNPDKYHFTKSVGIEIDELEGFSLYFKEHNDDHIVYVVDDKGKDLIDGFAKTTKIAKANGAAHKEHEFKSKIKLHHNRLPKVFEHIYDSHVWQEVAEKCVGCGTCNLLCPTCYCFDVRDEVELSIDEGKRERFWDGCMLNSFAEVAGGENFREKLSNRTRHRLHRKFKYLSDATGELYCVGCGRCTKFCPAEISIVDIANRLIDDYTNQQQKQSF